MSFLQLRSFFFKNILGVNHTITAVVTGTVVSSATEAEIAAGGETIIITLSGGNWVTGIDFTNQRQNIINGIDSAQSEGTGWDAVVKAGQTVGGVVRTSDTVVTITLDAFGSYNISSNETITVTVPGTAISTGISVVATPTFSIIASGVVEAVNVSWRNLLGVGI